MNDNPQPDHSDKPQLDSFNKPFKKNKRVKTPTLLQMEATECGAAALGSILGYYGLFLPLEKLREECGVSRDGSKAINMLKAARRYGMVAQGAKVEDIYDIGEIPLPAIAFWEFNHFVVIEGFKGSKFYINDPATGPRIVEIDEFNRAFTGVILIFEPGPEFKKGGKPLSLFRIFYERLKGSWSPLIFIILASIALVIPGLIVAGFIKIFIDEILIRGTDQWLPVLITGFIVTALLRGLLTWMQQKSLLQLHLKLMLINSAKFLWHVLHLPVNFFQQRFAGDIEERVGANDRIAQLLSGQISNSVVGLISMFFYGIIMFLFSWQLSLLVVVIASFNILLFVGMSRKIADISRQLLQKEGSLNGVEMNGLLMIETLKATAAEAVFFNRWASEHAQTVNNQQKIMMYGEALQIIPGFLNSLMMIAILGWGAWLVMQGHLTIGSLVAFQSLVGSFSSPLNSLLGFAEQMQEIRGDLLRLDDVYKYPALNQDEESEKKDKEELQTYQPLPGELSLQNVIFGYSPLDEPTLKDITLKLEKGGRIAIVGATGSGKTTLVRLICRLYKPWSGSIELAGQPLSEVSVNQFSQTISMVDQDIFLFAGTIRDNLTLWNPKIEESKLFAALEDARIADVVIARGGLDSTVSEGGANYSGGQRQRLEISRALVNEPSLLILDEATSSLDASVELEIYNNIKKRDCSVIIIAHRLSAIRDSDEIIVMDQGQIVERGTHDQLISQENGVYQSLLSVGE